LKLNENNPDAIATKGALLLLRARTDSDPEERSKIAAVATTELERELQLNSILRNQYELSLKEAQNVERASQP